jgi:type I restriction enzyme M protein
VATYDDFHNGKLKSGITEDKYSFVATVDAIVENDYNLNIPRYVDTFEEEAAIDIALVQNEIAKLEKELQTVQLQMQEYLKELID